MDLGVSAIWGNIKNRVVAIAVLVALGLAFYFITRNIAVILPTAAVPVAASATPLGMPAQVRQGVAD